MKKMSRSREKRDAMKQLRALEPIEHAGTRKRLRPDAKEFSHGERDASRALTIK
jgi:hypothetical protein